MRGPDGAGNIAQPADVPAGADVLKVDLRTCDGAVGLLRGGNNLRVLARGDGRGNLQRQGEWDTHATGVIDVLTDDVDAARSGPHAGGRGAEFGVKQGGGIGSKGVRGAAFNPLIRGHRSTTP